ncbi:MAG: DUF1802 family protein [Fimbriiglobus sp.]
MLGMGFKEWAVVCEAIARGEQTIILRKGGISENNGEFTPDHAQFWLYPTYFHEPQRDGIREEYLSLLAEIEGQKPAPGMVALRHKILVTAVDFVQNLDELLKFRGKHILSENTVRQRYHYRTPGLYVLHFQVFTESAPILIPELEHYAGCKTWVEF